MKQWFLNKLNNKLINLKNWLISKKYLFITLFVLVISSLYLTRAFYYHKIDFIRQYLPNTLSFAILFSLIILFLILIKKKKFVIVNYILLIVTSILLIFNFFFNKEIFDYLNSRSALNNLVIKELEYLPKTSKERIYPLETIVKIARDKINSSSYTVEHFEIVYNKENDDLYFNGEKSPIGNINKLTNVTGLVSINATKDQIDMKELEIEFNYGRKLKWFNSLDYILPKMLSLPDFFDKTIDNNVRLIQTKDGWVQVVGVTNWEGIFTVYPQFAGVFVIRQKSPDYNHVTFLNTDLFVPIDNPEIVFLTPEEIAKTDYLKGQNLVPEEITKFYANIWSYKNGLWNLFVGKKDLTKPIETMNVVYFEDVKTKEETKKGIFQFYPLEPLGENSSLSDILLFDTSGIAKEIVVYNYNSNKNKVNILGPSRIMKTIKDSDKHIDWGNFTIVETRPFIKDINGERKFFYFNTVIAKELSSSKPTIAVADPNNLDVFWFNGNNILEELNTKFKEY